MRSSVIVPIFPVTLATLGKPRGRWIPREISRFPKVIQGRKSIEFLMLLVFTAELSSLNLQPEDDKRSGKYSRNTKYAKYASLTLHLDLYSDTARFQFLVCDQPLASYKYH